MGFFGEVNERGRSNVTIEAHDSQIDFKIRREQGLGRRLPHMGEEESGGRE